MGAQSDTRTRADGAGKVIEKTRGGIRKTGIKNKRRMKETQTEKD